MDDVDLGDRSHLAVWQLVVSSFMFLLRYAFGRTGQSVRNRQGNSRTGGNAKQKLRHEDEEVVVFLVEHGRYDLSSRVVQWIKPRVDKSEVKEVGLSVGML